MLKKKNNLICFITIIITLITGTLTTNSYIHQLKTHSSISQLNNNYYENNSSNNTNLYGPQDSDLFNNKSSNLIRQNISFETLSIIIVCAVLFSFAVIYLIMSKFSTKNIFIDHDKRMIYALTTCLLSIVIIFTNIIVLNNLQQNISSQQDNNQGDNSIINNKQNYFSI